jgi:hypothetical protein
MNRLMRLSFGFTVNRRLAVCIGQLQNAPRRYFNRSRYVEVALINETLAAFSIEEADRWLRVKAKGQLKYVDDTSTVVSGEIEPKISLMDLILPAIFCIALFIFFALLNGGILIWVTLGWFMWFVFSFIVGLRARHSRMTSMLTGIRELLDPKLG